MAQLSSNVNLSVETIPLEPFGLQVTTSTPNARIEQLNIDTLQDWLRQHRLIVLRGFAPFAHKEDLANYCQSWGELLRWDFGLVFEVTEHASPQNYLFTTGSVPYHWDGAFAAQEPFLQFFQCAEAPLGGEGGETLFCDTNRIFAAASPTTQAYWRTISINYFTDKVAHYGGQITVPLVADHPHEHYPVLRYAEPANDDTVRLNTPALEIPGLSQAESGKLLGNLKHLIYDSRYVYKHAWQPGDYLIADNHTLLHGRLAYRPQALRRLWRVHIL